uniref:Doublecortin domain containing 2B n=1 Tax=Aquila chrysaetos chrysaetos TaxID=223781 RepID=A0A663EJK4_AQUCH
SAGALAPPAKNVVVYRNGDPFFPGRKFVVNQRRFPTFEAFLNEVTKSIRAPLAVRNIYTPRHGHRIAELGDLQDGCQYVAAGFEKFKKLDAAPQGQFPASTRTICCKYCPGTSGCVFRNGDLLSPPFPLPLSKSTSLQWDALLATLTEKADLHSGAVKKLCRLDGTQVSSGEELVNGDYYVAVGNEEYKKLPYFELLVPQDSARRTLWYVDCGQFGELCATSQDRAGDSALAEPPQQVGVTAKSVLCVPCICFTCSINLKPSQRMQRYSFVPVRIKGHRGKLQCLRDCPAKLLLFYKLVYQEGLSEACGDYFQLDSRRMQTTGAAEKGKIPAAFPQLPRQARKSCLREEESIFHAKPVRAGQNRRSNRNMQHWPDQGKGHCCKHRGRLALL